MPDTPKDILEEMLRRLGFDSRVAEHKLEESLLLEVQADDSGRLIGRQGQTLADLQYILNRLVFEKDPQAPKVTVDVAGYRQQQQDALIKKAKDAAEKVRRWGDVVELEPMNAYDRRIVHTTLRDDPDIETHSVEVAGSNKKVILLRLKH
jgi:spoIIIJ-associated protein